VLSLGHAYLNERLVQSVESPWLRNVINEQRVRIDDPHHERSHSVREMKARLRQMGVADEILSSCVEKYELEPLLGQEWELVLTREVVLEDVRRVCHELSLRLELLPVIGQLVTRLLGRKGRRRSWPIEAVRMVGQAGLPQDMAPTDAPLLKVPWLIVWWSSIVVLLEEHVDWLFWKSM